MAQSHRARWAFAIRRGEYILAAQCGGCFLRVRTASRLATSETADWAVCATVQTQFIGPNACEKRKWAFQDTSSFRSTTGALAQLPANSCELFVLFHHRWDLAPLRRAGDLFSRYRRYRHCAPQPPANFWQPSGLHRT